MSDRISDSMPFKTGILCASERLETRGSSHSRACDERSIAVSGLFAGVKLWTWVPSDSGVSKVENMATPTGTQQAGRPASTYLSPLQRFAMAVAMSEEGITSAKLNLTLTSLVALPSAKR